MDDADRAGDSTDKFEAEAVAFISDASKHRELIPVGACHYCNEYVDAGMLFCQSIDRDIGCSFDYKREQEARKRNGT